MTNLKLRKTAKHNKMSYFKKETKTEIDFYDDYNSSSEKYGREIEEKLYINNLINNLRGYEINHIEY